MTATTKDSLKQHLVECLAPAEEIRKIVVFGSFLQSDTPNDMDVAVFVEGNSAYLPLALKFRKMTKSVAQQIPLDIIPVRPDASGPMLDEIKKGEMVYER